MRHVSRTHRVHLDWLYERFLHDPYFRIKYVKTKYQIADILTKGAFTKDQWKALLQLCSITQPISKKKENTEEGRYACTCSTKSHAIQFCSRSSQFRSSVSGNRRTAFRTALMSASSHRLNESCTSTMPAASSSQSPTTAMLSRPVTRLSPEEEMEMQLKE